jgi:hypothetical protein
VSLQPNCKGGEELSGGFSIAKMEKRMRPGALSEQGFLGPTESLEAVMAQDDQTLGELGVAQEEIAGALEKAQL